MSSKMFIPTPFSLHHKDFKLHQAPISLDCQGLKKRRASSASSQINVWKLLHLKKTYKFLNAGKKFQLCPIDSGCDISRANIYVHLHRSWRFIKILY